VTGAEGGGGAGGGATRGDGRGGGVAGDVVIRWDGGSWSWGRETVGAAEGTKTSAREPPQNRQNIAVGSDAPWHRGQTRDVSTAGADAPRSTTRAG
jgi:hypothetical protein